MCQTDKKQNMSRVLARVARYFVENGHVVRTLPHSLLLSLYKSLGRLSSKREGCSGPHSFITMLTQHVF